MARSHIVSPLDAAYLRKVAQFLGRISSGFESAAKGLEDTGLGRVRPEKWQTLWDGLNDLRNYFDQICDGVTRAELEKLWEEISKEPFPKERVVLKGGKPITPEQAAEDMFSGKGQRPGRKPKRKKAKKSS